MNTSESESDPEELIQLLSSAPGVTNIHAIEPHQRGGYRAAFDLSLRDLDKFIGYLESTD